MFTKMLPLAETSYEKALLQAAIQDISNDGYVGQLSQRIYDAEHQGSDSPAFPFLERCFLPILLKKGDLAKTRRGSKTEAFLVWSTPENLPECSDLTDECYYCYSLNCNVPEDLFLIHEHIHICFADGGTCIYEWSDDTSHQRDDITSIYRPDYLYYARVWGGD